METRRRQAGTDEPRRRWTRLVGALPAMAFLATFGVFFVDKNREARTVFGSGRGLLAIAVIVGGYVVLAAALRRVTRRRAWVPPVLLAAVVLALAAWIVRPYYVDETVNRALVTGPVRDASAVSPEPSSGTATSIPSPSPSPSPSPDGTAAPAAAVRLSTGTLRGIDHDAGGTASLIRTEQGGLVVRFERFEIEGSPDPQLYLVDGEDARRPGGVHLGRMPGNRGDVLDVEVPAGTDGGPGWTVLVWCGRFAVPIANATQTAA